VCTSICSSAMQPTLIMGCATAEIKRRNNRVILLVTGHEANTLNRTTDQDLGDFFCFMERELLRPQRAFFMIVDVRSYPYLPSSSAVQRALAWFGSNKLMQVATVIILQDSFWSAGARTIVNFMMKASPPQNPFLVCHSLASAEEFVQQVNEAGQPDDQFVSAEDLMKAASSGVFNRTDSFCSSAEEHSSSEVIEAADGSMHVMQSWHAIRYGTESLGSLNRPLSNTASAAASHEASLRRPLEGSSCGSRLGIPSCVEFAEQRCASRTIFFSACELHEEAGTSANLGENDAERESDDSEGFYPAPPENFYPALYRAVDACTPQAKSKQQPRYALPCGCFSYCNVL